VLEEMATDPKKAAQLAALRQQQLELSAKSKQAFSMGADIDKAVDWFDAATKDVFNAVGLGEMGKWQKLLLTGGILMMGGGGMMGSGLATAIGGVALLGGLAGHYFPGMFGGGDKKVGRQHLAITPESAAAADKLTDEKIQEVMAAAGKLSKIESAPKDSPWWVQFGWGNLDKNPLAQHLLHSVADPKKRGVLRDEISSITKEQGVIDPKTKKLTPLGARRLAAVPGLWDQVTGLLEKSKSPSYRPGLDMSSWTAQDYEKDAWTLLQRYRDAAKRGQKFSPQDQESLAALEQMFHPETGQLGPGGARTSRYVTKS
jgi:hypothetical protein